MVAGSSSVTGCSAAGATSGSLTVSDLMAVELNLTALLGNSRSCPRIGCNEAMVWGVVERWQQSCTAEGMSYSERKTPFLFRVFNWLFFSDIENRRLKPKKSKKLKNS